MSPRRPDDRDRQPPKSPPLGVPIERWDEQSSSVHQEPWLFRALRDIKAEITGIREEQVEQGKAIAGLSGEFKQLSTFIPRPKSPSDGVTRALLADKIDESKVRRRWWLKVGGGALLLAIAAGFRWWLG